MKKLTKKSLRLSRETVSKLNEVDLIQIGGGKFNATKTMCQKDTCFLDTFFLC